MKQYIIYTTYVVAILIFVFLSKTHKPQGLGDISSLIWLILAGICLVGLIVSIVLRSNGFAKVAVISLGAGIIICSLIVIGIILTDKYDRSKRIAKHHSRVKEQKEFYSDLKVLEKFSVQTNRNTQDSITSVTATIALSDHKLLNGWDMKLIAFVEPDPNQLLLRHKLFESNYIPVKPSGEQKVEAMVTTGRYGVKRLIGEEGEDVKLEYILLFVDSKDQYVEVGLNEGFAYTSLSKERVEDIWSGTLQTISPKSYALFQHRLMYPKINFSINDLVLVYRIFKAF